MFTYGTDSPEYQNTIYVVLYAASKYSSVYKMRLIEEKTHRKGVFSHSICLYAEGVFLYLLVRADVLCIIFDYVAIV